MKTNTVLLSTSLAALGLATAAAAYAVSKPEIDQRVTAAVTQFEALSPSN